MSYVTGVEDYVGKVVVGGRVYHYAVYRGYGGIVVARCGPLRVAIYPDLEAPTFRVGIASLELLAPAPEGVLEALYEWLAAVAADADVDRRSLFRAARCAACLAMGGWCPSEPCTEPLQVYEEVLRSAGVDPVAIYLAYALTRAAEEVA